MKKQLPYPEALVEPGPGCIAVDGRVALVDARGRAYWAREGPRILDAETLEKIRAVQVRQEEPESSRPHDTDGR